LSELILSSDIFDISMFSISHGVAAA